MSKKKSITRGTRKKKKYIETKFMIEEVYQNATEIFLSGLKEEAACYGHMPPTIIDMKRDVENSFDPKLPKTDSSSWTFHVEECPGWKFGLWWESVDANSPDDKPKIPKSICAKGQSGFFVNILHESQTRPSPGPRSSIFAFFMSQFFDGFHGGLNVFEVEN